MSSFRFFSPLAFALLFAFPAAALPPVDISAFQSDAADHPAKLRLVVFEKRDGGGPVQKVSVTLGGKYVRFDLPDDRLRVIYEPVSQSYLGLELSDATYWTFSWPKVSELIAKSARYQSRMQELSNDGLQSYAPDPSAALPPLTTPSTPPPLPPNPPPPVIPSATTPTDTNSIFNLPPPDLTPPSPSPAANSPTPSPMPTPNAAAAPDLASNPIPDAPVMIWKPLDTRKVISGIPCKQYVV